jgi:C4-dicarboxylate-specific signal transduction histidine kinase
MIAWEVFVLSADSEIHYFYLLFLPVAWITIRHGQRGAALALAFVYLAPVITDQVLTHDGKATAELQIRLGALAVTALLLGAMVSERRRSQEQMLTQQNELAHFQRLNVGWEMASALAHELNQPLSAAMNYSQAALRLISAPSPDLQRATNTLAKGVDQIELAGKTIHGLRNFMRKGELRLTLTRVDDLVDNAFRLVAGEAHAANVMLRAESLSELPPIMADQIQIVQVLVNLVRNAVQAIEAANMNKGTVTIAAAATADAVSVSVTDTGPGIEPQIEARLFEPFVTSKHSGMGLGLAISKSILNAHAGELLVEPSPRGGAAFRFTLPLAHAETTDA